MLLNCVLKKKVLTRVNCMLRFTTIQMFSRPSLEVWWLRLCSSNAGSRAEGQIPAWGTGSYMLGSAAKQTNKQTKTTFRYKMDTCVHALSLSHVFLFATPWTVAHQAPLSMGFSRQEHWRGLPSPPPGDLPHPGIEPTSPALASGFFYHWAIREAKTDTCPWLKKERKKEK